MGLLDTKCLGEFRKFLLFLRGIRKLVDVLASEETTEQAKLEAFSLLAPQLSTQESKISALQDGLIEAASSLLSSNSPPLVTAACVVLTSISTQLQVRWAWKTASVLQRLCPLLSDSDESVAGAAAHALCMFVSFPDGASAVFESCGSLEHLVASVSKSQWAVLPLAAFLAHYTELQEAAVQLGAVEATVPWIRTGVHEDVLLQACRAFRTMATGSSGKQRCLASGLVDAVLALLADSPTVPVSGSAMCTLCLLGATEKAFLDMIHERLTPELVAMIAQGASSGDPTLQHNSVLCIQRMSALGSLKDSFALHLAGSVTTELFLQVYATSAFESLLKTLIFADTSSKRQQAAATCSAAAKLEGGGAALSQTLNCVPALLVGCAQHMLSGEQPPLAQATHLGDLNASAAIEVISHISQQQEPLNKPSTGNAQASTAAAACIAAAAAAAAFSPAARQQAIDLLRQLMECDPHTAALAQEIAASESLQELGLEVA